MKKSVYTLFALALVLCGSACSSSKNATKEVSQKENEVKQNIIKVAVSGQIAGHDYVDLGLPSRTKWATCNVGAIQPTENGDYFAWGETAPKNNYNWSTYKFEAESYKSLNGGYGLWSGCNKYTIASQKEDSVAWYDNNGKFIGDSLRTLEPADDAATANWGSSWRMPTKNDLQELISGCNWEWTTDFNGSGVAGRIGTSKFNGNIIFIPAAGEQSSVSTADYGYYWLSSLSDAYSFSAYIISFNSQNFGIGRSARNYGRSVRAVTR